jgi:hypothetical protein
MPEIEGARILFASNDSSLTAESMATLDSFAIRAKKASSTAFFITGNTDDKGTNHQALSQARINSAVDYLEKKHNIPAFRFFQASLGNSNPVSEGKTEENRKQNRRVEIRHAPNTMEEVIYRNMLLKVFDNKKDDAFKLLSIWLRIAKNKKKIYLLVDPRIETLKSDRRWDELVLKKVKESYSSQKKPKLAFQLDSLGKEDQKCRTLKYYTENLNAYLPAIDSSDTRFDVAYFPDTAEFQCACRDERHYQALKNLLGENDWPKISEVGERPAEAAFFLVSHTTDTTAFVRYLPILKQRCEEGEATWNHYATMYDRHLVMQGLPQRYGTQFKPPKPSDTSLEPFPLEDPTKVNEWRAEIGLEPLNSNR